MGTGGEQCVSYLVILTQKLAASRLPNMRIEAGYVVRSTTSFTSTTSFLRSRHQVFLPVPDYLQTNFFARLQI